MIDFARRHLALTGGRARFHHVSTLATLLCARSAGLTEVDEDTVASAETAGRPGYPRSKALAEIELRARAEEFSQIASETQGVVSQWFDETSAKVVESVKKAA